MELQYYEKVNIINQAIKDGKLLLQTLSVNSESNNLTTYKNYSKFAEIAINKNDSYFFYVNDEYYPLILPHLFLTDDLVKLVT